MSAVIEFPLDRVRPSSQDASTPPAEVIIFPGIRFERLNFDLAERLPVRRKELATRANAKDYDFY